MAQASKIQWTDTTWNPVAGCTKVSDGCRNCYAMGSARRLAAIAEADLVAGRNPGRKAHYRRVVAYSKCVLGVDPHPLAQWNNKVVCVDEALADPLHRKKPRRIFVNSMSDLFHKDVPVEFIVKVRAVMALTPHHTYQTLTKRPERMEEIDNSVDMPAMIYRQVSRWLDHFDGDPLGSGPLWNIAHKLAEWRGEGERWTWLLPNEWKGTSVENQAAADERRDHLRRCPASVKFVSYEPALERVDWTGWEFIDQLIIGGESGRNARPFNVDWARDSIAWCREHNIRAFVKQLGAKPAFDPNTETGVYHHMEDGLCIKKLRDSHGGDMSEWPEDLRVREMPEEAQR
jgi:protein gp37